MRARKKIQSLKLLLVLGLLLPAAGPVSGRESEPQIQEKLQRRVSLDLRDMNVVDVYRFLAMRGDFNVSISKDIAGRVTLFMKDVSIEDALDIISIANNLGYRIMGRNIVHVMPESEYVRIFGQEFSDKRSVVTVRLSYAKPSYVLETLKNVKSAIGKIVIDEESGSVVMIDTEEKIAEMKQTITQIDQPLLARVFKLRHADAGSIERQIRQKLEPQGVGYAQADARSNQLIVRALPGRMKEVETIIEALDQKTKAVRIVAQILKITYNPEFEKGIEWPTVFSFKHQGTKSFDGTGFVSTFKSGGISVDEFQVKLNLMDQVSSTKVLANPTITVVHDQEAKIHIGDVLAYVTTTTFGTGDDREATEQVHFLDVGVELQVIPRISDDNFITMKIRPQISSQVGTLETPLGSRIPLVDTTTVETEVIARDGETIIIGGLRKDDIVRSEKRTPYLSGIPLLGNLFTNISESERNTEIAILLTPHIIAEGDLYQRQQERQQIRPDKEALPLRPDKEALSHQSRFLPAELTFKEGKDAGF